jgi:prophage regulatory protein
VISDVIPPRWDIDIRSAYSNTARSERRRCALVLRVPGGQRTSDLRGRERAGQVFHRRKPLQGQIMPKTISAPAAPTAALPVPQRAPAMPETGFLRQPQVLAFVPISKSTLWRRVQARTFPEPLKLSARITVWRAEDIRRWIAQQAIGS